MRKILNIVMKYTSLVSFLLHRIIPVVLCLSFLFSCRSHNTQDDMLRYALQIAGLNRQELERVLNHYSEDSLKLRAARFLIENMPGHYSYRGDLVDDYYDIAIQLFNSELTPQQQRDSLWTLTNSRFYPIGEHPIQDARIISSEYLIANIDKSFEVWNSARWAEHISFDEFCEWILPYKCTDFQSFDEWRNVLSSKFSNNLSSMPYDDESYESTFRAVNTVRQEIIDSIHPIGMYTKSIYPMLSAETISRMTFGTCADYVNLGVLTFRSLGIPAIIEETPSWGRYRAGHSWYVVLNDNGEELRSEWDISSCPGSPFFPYQRIPKVYRHTYSINKSRIDYQNNSRYKYPFSLFQVDVTDKYYNTSDITIDIPTGVKLSDKFAYIATFNGFSTEWQPVDYAPIMKSKATFVKMGRNILYIALGFDGNALIPISNPFIIHKDGSVEYIKCNFGKRRSVDIRRKYYESENVVSMRNRIKGGRIQAADNASFANPVTMYIIDDIYLSDKTEINSDLHKYRYWRYLSADGTYGSVAELAFFNANGDMLNGKPIAVTQADDQIISNAFDNDWLSNFETDIPDGNWVGLDFGTPVSPSYFRVIPRSDDNDIHPGDTYELKYWTGAYWVTHDIRVADSNILHYDSLPSDALLWVHDRTRGWDERPFLVDGNGNVEWW